MSRWHYYRRIFQAYLGGGSSHLSFWHDEPAVNSRADFEALGEYYMPFYSKARYAGPFDSAGIPMLDYRGRIGLQYNPIAVAQWGLGNFNFFARNGGNEPKKSLLAASDWLARHLEENSQGISVWNHHFDWEYRALLRAPWYSALAQGQGISLLLRAHAVTGAEPYRAAAARAFEAFLHSVDKGGVAFTDSAGNLWFEEYIVNPPTHVLNGFIWAAWGVFDYFLATGSPVACDLFDAAVITLRASLDHYDLGFWSLYEQSDTWLPMLASPFYHRLHIAQLRVMHRMTGDDIFGGVADRWQSYLGRRSNRTRAICYKAAFKLGYY
ncbi:MAG TPA: D-glucuronyl C5-epimerase family protein [Terriglobales bacterium]